MTNFRFEVSTQPMAREVGTVSSHVQGVTAAVVTMQTAVISAEKKSAETICENVDRGFYFLVKSQISQKAAKLNSEVTSKLMVLGQLGMALKSVKKQMEGDYAMIASRYMKLFHSLDNALRTRIFELDKVASRLAIAQRTDLYSRSIDLGCSLLVHQRESLPLSQSVAVSRFKRNALKGLESIAFRLKEEAILNEDLKHSIESSAVSERVEQYIPLVITEFDSIQTDGTILQTVAPPWPNTYRKIGEIIENEVAQKATQIAWQTESAEVRQDVAENIKKILEASDVDQRVKEGILRLFEASVWLETSEGQP